MKTNYTMKNIRHLLLLLTYLFLTACSDQSPFISTTTSSADGTTTTDTIVSSVRIGSIVNSTFTDGIVSVSPNTLSAGGTAAITVNIVDANGDPVTTSTTVNYSSPCASDGLAALSNATQTTTTGTATTNYLAQGCTGSDIVTATLSGTTQKATGTVTVASATAGSIEFSSVTNTLIALSGTGSVSGLPETSTVKFIVKDDLGLPVQGEDVNFSLNSTVGGISLSSIIATSDGLGEVITTVQSGTVATSVRVTASLASDPALATTSTAIAIATGPPDQDSMSLAASELNPRAWDINGKEVIISAFLADRFNNPITDGTAISFTTELGSIEPSCSTSNGGCSVIWRSQNPRTTSITAVVDGITSILATVEGEESFTDFDVNGVFSDGDTFTDMAEAFRDDTDNGAHDPGEFFLDFNVDGVLNVENGLYNGKGCTHSTLCDTIVDSITVRQSIRLLMAEDNPEVYAIAYDGVAVSLISPPTFSTLTNRSISFTIGGSQNGQILPVGTTLAFSTKNGKITSGASHTILNDISPANTYTVSITDDGTSSNDGELTLKITIGDGGGTYENIFPLPIGIDDRSVHTIGGTVNGLPGGESLVIQNDGGDDLTVLTDGTFVFNTSIIDGSTYNVTIKTQPVTPTCTVTSGGSGTVDADDVTNVVIDCI